jgi:hypothetical protein
MKQIAMQVIFGKSRYEATVYQIKSHLVHEFFTRYYLDETRQILLRIETTNSLAGVFCAAFCSTTDRGLACS